MFIFIDNFVKTATVQQSPMKHGRWNHLSKARPTAHRSEKCWDVAATT